MQKVKDIRTYLKEALGDKYPDTELRSFYHWILEYLFDFRTVDALMNAENTLESEDISDVKKITELLAKQKPIQQIVGYSWFYGQKFSVNDRVLIPRPETEELVDWILKEGSDKKSLLDIGTGSGCIPISIAKNSSAKVSTMDISEEALSIAKKNANKLMASINFIHGDIFDNSIVSELPSYDIIVSNPPYVLEADKKMMSTNVLDFEPHIALFVPNDDALKFYIRIVEIASKILNPGGFLYFEIHESKGLEITRLLEYKGFSSLVLKQDMQGKDRMIKARWNT